MVKGFLNKVELKLTHSVNEMAMKRKDVYLIFGLIRVYNLRFKIRHVVMLRETYEFI